MSPKPLARPAMSSAASLFLFACESPQPNDPEGSLHRTEAAASPTYFPPPESNGGWRTTSDRGRIDDLGLDRDKIESLGKYLMALPHENYSTGVSGYKPSHKAAIVVKGGWIVGEYYNQPGADRALYYTASNGKTFAMLLAGNLAQTYPKLNFSLSSKLYDQRWLSEGFPLSDGRKSGITLDHVFRHASGVIPEAHHAIADGAVQTEKGWTFTSFTVGKNKSWEQSSKLAYAPGKPSSYSKGRTYSSVAFNHLSLIIRNVTGKEAGAYLQQAMLDRIGVGKVAYKVTAGMDGTRYAAAGNVLMTARDFMRVGYLMLQEGDWNGRRIFPAAWLQRFTQSTAYPNIRSNQDCYWGSEYPADLYRTVGSGQNWMLVVPSLDLVLTFNGRTPASKKAEVDRVSLERLFAAVTERYVTCNGRVVN